MGQDTQRKLLAQALKEDAALNLAWDKFWGRPEKVNLKRALKAQKKLQENGFYVSEKLQKNAKWGKNFISLSANEIHTQNAVEKEAFEVITVLIKEVNRLQSESDLLKSRMRKMEPEESLI